MPAIWYARSQLAAFGQLNFKIHLANRRSVGRSNRDTRGRVINCDRERRRSAPPPTLNIQRPVDAEVIDAGDGFCPGGVDLLPHFAFGVMGTVRAGDFERVPSRPSTHGNPCLPLMRRVTPRVGVKPRTIHARCRRRPECQSVCARRNFG